VVQGLLTVEIIILEGSGRSRRIDTAFPVYCIVSGCCRVLDVYWDGVTKRKILLSFSLLLRLSNQNTWASHEGFMGI